MRTHKTCKECGVTHELSMFHKKGGKYNKLRSKCKICYNPSGKSYTCYYYPTSEMQRLAELNNKRLTKEIRLGAPKCHKCNEPTNRRGKLCMNCKSISIRLKKRRMEKKRSAIKSRKKRENLASSYIKSLIVQQKDRIFYGLKRSDISEDLIELKRTQLSLIRQLKVGEVSVN